MHTPHILSSLVIGALVLTGCNLLTGCNKDGEDTGAAATKTSNDTSSASESNSEGGNSTTGTPVTTTDPTNAEGTAGGTGETGTSVTSGTDTAGTDCGFVCETESAGGTAECDIWKQDCPPDQKCMPWANDGGNSWNATLCSPLDADPKQAGDSCEVEGSAVSGVDNCALGLICWFVDDMNVGTCIEMCTGTPDAPSCPNGKTCDESNEGVIIVCLETCDPLAQSCPEGQICFSDGVDNFICDFDASGEEGQYGDPCFYVNDCDYGLFCAGQANVPNCESADGCCSTYCNLMEPNTCPGKDATPAQECVPWYEGMDPPPGQENIGACAVPM